MVHRNCKVRGIAGEHAVASHSGVSPIDLGNPFGILGMGHDEKPGVVQLSNEVDDRRDRWTMRTAEDRCVMLLVRGLLELDVVGAVAKGVAVRQMRQCPQRLANDQIREDDYNLVGKQVPQESGRRRI